MLEVPTQCWFWGFSANICGPQLALGGLQMGLRSQLGLGVQLMLGVLGGVGFPQPALGSQITFWGD